MELRNRKRLRYDHSTYIPSVVDDEDTFDNLDNNIYLAFGFYIFFFGIVSFAVMTCNMKYNNPPINKPFVPVVPMKPAVIYNMNIQPIDTLTYLMKNSTESIQKSIEKHLPIQPVPEIKTRIYSVYIQTSNHSSSYEFHRNRHTILNEFIHTTNNKNRMNLFTTILQKYNSNFNSCFIRINEYSQSNIFSPNTYNLIASNTFLSTNRPTEFIDITIVSGNQKINASQSVITVYDVY
jgi:hypothetical protein